MKNNDTKKIVIIGSGPAGLTAAVYASRAGLDPLVFEGKEPGGQLMGTTNVENWPGEVQILGPELMQNMRKHAQYFGAKLLSQTIISVDLRDKPFKLVTNKNDEIYTKALIIATGATPKRLNCPGEEEFWGKGVSTCAVCDGAFYRDRKVVVVGGGDSAMESASFLTNFTQKVTIIQNLDELTASPSMKKRVLQDKNIEIIYRSTVTRVIGDKNVEAVEITNQKTGQKRSISTEGVFIAVGLKPNTDLFKGQLEMTEYGHLKLTQHSKTSINGVFAAGDVVDNRYRQAITSAGTGCQASLDAERYLKE